MICSSSPSFLYVFTDSLPFVVVYMPKAVAFVLLDSRHPSPSQPMAVTTGVTRMTAGAGRPCPLQAAYGAPRRHSRRSQSYRRRRYDWLRGESRGMSSIAFVPRSPCFSTFPSPVSRHSCLCSLIHFPLLLCTCPRRLPLFLWIPA